MKLEELLPSIPVERWKPRQVYSYDWYDGPRQGVCSLAEPEAEFYFELLDERYNPDGPDDRLFRLSELPPGSVAEVLSAVQDLANPSEEVRQRARHALQLIDAKRRPTPLVIYTQDMTDFLGCWTVDRVQEYVADWFSLLKLSKTSA